jgi:RNA polymerase sigma-70 factor (ECF subfamily)
MNDEHMTTGVESLGSTSSSLLRRAQSRDPEAWRRLVKVYGPIVFLWGRQVGLSGHDSADIVQETFVAVAGHIASFRRERPGDSFRGWLWTITRNKIRDHFRRRHDPARPQGGTTAQRMLAQIADDISEVDAIGDSLLGVAERRAIELIRVEFEERTWRAFWLTAVEGRTAAEVGVELGMAKGAVRQAKYRVLRRLREELEGLLD